MNKLSRLLLTSTSALAMVLAAPSVARAADTTIAFPTTGTYSSNITVLSGDTTTLQTDTGATTTLTGVITETGNLNFTGPGAFDLTSLPSSSWNGVTTLNGGVTVTISNASQLSGSQVNLGDSSSGATLSLSGVDYTHAITLGTGGTNAVTGSGILSGLITGSGGLTFADNSAITIPAGRVNDYTGATTIGAGATVTLLASQGFGTNRSLILDGGELISGALDKDIVLTGDSTLYGHTGNIYTQAQYFGSITGNHNLAFTGDSDDVVYSTLSVGALSLTSFNPRVYLHGDTTVTGLVNLTAGILDTSAMTSSPQIGGLAGTGSFQFGGTQTLTISNAGPGAIFSGGLSSASSTDGGVIIAGGTQEFDGYGFYYSGPTEIQSGATLVVGTGALNNSRTIVDAGGTLKAADGAQANVYNLEGAGQLVLGAGSMLSLVTDGGFHEFSGAISGASDAYLYLYNNETLSGASTYAGAVIVNNGVTLTLAGAGSLGGVVAVAQAFGPSNPAGTLDISGVTTGGSVGGLQDGGTVILGSKTLTLTNAISDISNTYSWFSGNFSGTGNVTLTGGTQILSGDSSATYSGTTTVAGGATLIVMNAGALGSGGLTTNHVTAPGGLALAGGTLDLRADLANAITVSADSVIDNTDADHALTGAISGSHTLKITGNAAVNIASDGTNFTGILENASSATLGLSGFFSGATLQLDAGTTTTVNYPNGVHLGGLTGSGTLNLTGYDLRLEAGNSTFDGDITGNMWLYVSDASLTLTHAVSFASSAFLYNGTLALTGAGSLQNVNLVQLNGGSTFDISGITASGTSVRGLQSLSSDDRIVLGSKTLSVTGWGYGIQGVISGTGGMTFGAGTSYLYGANTYTGATTISDGAVLGLQGEGSVAGKVDTSNTGALVISGVTAPTSSIASLTGSGSVQLGGNTLVITNGNDTFGGDISGTGGLTVSGGTQTLSGANSLTGTVGVNAGATLALTGSGSAADAAAVQLANNGIFDISGTSSGTSITTLAGQSNSLVLLGNKTLTITASSTDFAGNISGLGGVTIAGGVQTFSGVSTYQGATTVADGATLQFAGSTTGIFSRVDTSTSGTLDISGATGTASTGGVIGSGSLTLGSRNLLLEYGSGTFAGAISGTSASSITMVGGSWTLSGDSGATYAGTTGVYYSGTLTAASAGALGAGGLILSDSTLNLGADLNNDLTVVGTSVINNTDALHEISGGNIAGTGTLKFTGDKRTALYVASSSFTGDVENASSDLVYLSLRTTGTLHADSGTETWISGTFGSLAGTGTVNLWGNIDLVGSGTFDGTLSGIQQNVEIWSGASLTLTSASTMSGGFDLNRGTLALSGAGSLDADAALEMSNASTFDISGLTGGGTSVRYITSSSADDRILLGSKTLTLNVPSNIAGVISGTGGVTLAPYSAFGFGTTLSNSNTYTGTTAIDGAILKLAGAGSVAGKVDTGTTGTLDITGVTTGGAVGGLDGNGSVNLGDKTLTINLSGISIFGGTVTGTGDITLNSGNLRLGGDNSATFSGTVTVAGGYLNLMAQNTLGTGSLVLAGGTLDLLGDVDDPILVAADSTIQNSNATHSLLGDLSGDHTLTIAGSNTIVFAGASSFAGLLDNTASATLQLQTSLADAAIQTESGATTQITDNLSVKSIAGAGTVSIDAGKTLTVNNASGSITGTVSGGGTLNVAGGTLTLAYRNNSYTGGTIVGNGATISVRDGTQTSQFSPFGSGRVLLDGGTLDYYGNGGPVETPIALGANGGTLRSRSGYYSFSGGVTDNVAGAGGLTINAPGDTGTIVLAGVNTFTGGVTVKGGTLEVYLNGALSDASKPVALWGGTTLSYQDGITIDNRLQLTGDVTLNALSPHNAATQNGDLNDDSPATPYTVTKTGVGTLLLAGANTTSANLVLAGGVLELAGQAQQFAGTHTFDGGTLQLDYDATIGSDIQVNAGGGTIHTTHALTLSGDIADGGASVGILGFDGSGAVVLSGDNRGFSGGLLVTGTHVTLGNAFAAGGSHFGLDNATVEFAAAGTYTNPFAVSNTGTLLVSSPGLVVLDGVISDLSGNGSLDLYTNAGGTLALAGANTYTGGTRLFTDTLVQVGVDTVGTAGSITSGALGTGTVSFTNGGALQAGGDVTLANDVALPTVGSLDANGHAFTLSGHMSGTGGLRLIDSLGGGSIAITDASNSFASGVVANTGVTLILTGSGGTGSGPLGTGPVTLDGATLRTDTSGHLDNALYLDGSGGTLRATSGTYAFGSIAGLSATSSLTIGAPGDAGTIVLDHASSYGGGTVIAGGTLGIGDSAALGTGLVTLSGGTLGVGADIANAIAVTADSTIDAQATVTLSGGISGDHVLTFTGTGNALTLSADGSFGGTLSNQIASGNLLLQASYAQATLETVTGSTSEIGGALSLKTITGGGDLTLDNTLTLTNASGSHSGFITGTGGLTVAGGTLTLNGAGDYQGVTEIDNGATLKETGSGSANSQFVVKQGGFLNLSGTTDFDMKDLAGEFGAAISWSTGFFEIHNAASTYAGTISGSGFLLIDSGTETLTGASSGFAGVIDVKPTATLALTGSMVGTVYLFNGGTLDVSGATGASVGTVQTYGTIATGTSGVLTMLRSADIHSAVQGSGTLKQAGGVLSIDSDITGFAGTFDIRDGAGLEILGAGLTPDATVTLEGSGSLSIANASGNRALASLSGDSASTVSLGTHNLTLNNAGGTFAGVIDGTGGLTIAGGTETLSGANTYTGTTIVSSGAVLALAGAGSIADGSVGLDGTLDISGTTTGATLGGMYGNGQVVLGGKTLTFNVTNDWEYTGGITGSGGLIVIGDSNGIQEFTQQLGYTGGTTLNGGGITLHSGGALAAGSDLVLNGGTFHDYATTAQTLGTVSGNGAAAVTLDGIDGGSLSVASWTQTSGNLQLTNGLQLTIGALSGSTAMNIATGTGLIAGDASDTVFSGAISGSGDLTKQGTGTLTLGGNNGGFTGTVIVSAGTLAAGSDTALSTVNTIAVDTGATLDLNGHIVSPAQLTGTGTVADSAGGGTLNIATSQTLDVTFIGGAGLTVSGGDVVLTGASAFTGQLVVSNGSSVTLGSNATIAGAAVVANGTLDLTGIAAGGASVGSLAGNGTVDATGKALTIDGSGTTTLYGTLNAASLTLGGSATQTLLGTANLTGPVTIGSGAYLALGGTASLAGLAVTDNGTFDITSVAASSTSIASLSGSGVVYLADKTLVITDGNATFSGDIYGTTGIVDITGTNQVLSGTGHYGGTTILDTGVTLTVGSATAFGTSVLDLQSGSTLKLALNGTVANNATLEAGASTFDVGTNTVVYGGNISGAGTLTKTGSGTLALTGTDSTAVVIGAGTLQIGNGGTSGTVSGDITDNAALVFARSDSVTYAGAISGSGSLTVASGTLLLTGSAAQNGGTTIASGATFALGDGSSFTGNVTDNGTFAFARNDSLTYAGTITGSGVVAINSGTVVLTGSAANTGGATIAGGATLQIGTGGSIAGAITDNGSLVVNRSGSVSLSNVISGSGSLTQAGSGTLILSGANTYTGGTTVSTGTLQLGADNALAGGVTIGSGAIFDLNGHAQSLSTLSGAGSVALGGGSLTLTGTNSLTNAINGSGTVKVAGSLNVGGTIGSATTTVVSGGVLSGTGTVSSLSVQSGGTLSPGTGGVGTLAVSGDLTLASGSSTAVDVTAAAADRITVSGAASIAGALNVNYLGAGFDVSQYTLISSTGTLSGTFDSLNLGGTAMGNLATTLVYDAHDVYLKLANTFVAGQAFSLDSGTANVNGPQTVGGLSGTGGTINTSGGTLTIDQPTDTTFSGTITGTGPITKTGSGTLILDGDNGGYSGPTTVSGGLFEIGDANHPNAVYGGSVTVGAGGTLGGHGTITGSVVNSGGTAPGGSIGTLTVLGNYGFASGASLQQEVAANGSADLLKVGGTVTIAGNTTVLVQPTDPVASYARVTSYTIVTGQGGVSGTFASASSSAASLTPILSYGPNAVNLTLVRNDISLATLANTANQAAVGGAISARPNTALFAAVAPLADAQLPAVFDSLSGEVHATLAGALLNDGRVLDDAIRARGAAGDGLHVWGNGDYRSGSFDGSARAAAASTHLSGFALGANTQVADGLRLGAAAGVTRNTLDIAARVSRGRVNSLYIGGYGGYEMGAYAFDVAVTHGWNTIGTSRTATGQTETADYNAGTTTASGEARYRAELGSNLLAEPFARLTAVWLSTDSFSETGGNAALNGAARDHSVLFSDVGARLSTSYQMGDTLLTPHASLAWEHAGGDIAATQSLSFGGGAAFNITGAPLARDAAALEAGIGADMGGWTLGLDYTGRAGNGASENGVRLRIGTSF